MILRKAVFFGLGSILTLALGACSGYSGGYSSLSAPEDGTSGDALIEEAGDALIEEAIDSTPALQASFNDPANATLASLVGFLVTESEGEYNDYAGISSDGVLTDYSYNEANSCYDSTSTQIIDQGRGIFWVQDGDVTTELRMARQNGNLILFRNHIDEADRVVYPGTNSIGAADLALCG